MTLLLTLLLTASLAASPDDLVDEAIANNPTLTAIEARTDQLRAVEDVAGAWPDPVVGIAYSNAPINTLGLSDHPMAGLQLEARQKLRPPSWSGARHAVASEAIAVSEQARGEAALQLGVRVEQTWWRLALARTLRVVTLDHVDRTQELLGSVRARYEVGAAGQHAILTLEVLRDRLKDEVEDFERADKVLTAALIRALARDHGSSFATPEALLPISPPEQLDAAVAVDQRPAIRGLDHQAARARAAADLARIDALPDPSVIAGYRLRTVETVTDPGTDLVTFGVSVPLPFGSGRAARGRRIGFQAEARAHEQAREGLLDLIQSDLDSALARWRRADRKARTYRDGLLPDAQTALTTTLSDYTVGRADFSTLYEAEVNLLNLDRGYLNAAAETHIQSAGIRGILGTTGGTP